MISETRLAGLRRSRDVEVVQDLEVIREELDRHHKDVGRTLGRERREQVDQIGPKPFLGGVPRALVRERPLLEAGFRGNGARRLFELVDVLGLGLEDPTRQTVSGQYDRGRDTRELAKRLSDRCRDRRDERRRAPPRASDRERYRRGLGHGPLVTGHQSVRPLR